MDDFTVEIKGLEEPKGERGPVGPKGAPGDVTVIGDAELQAAVRKLKAERARVQAALLIEAERAVGLHPNQRRHIQAVIARLKKEIDNDVSK